MLNTIGAQKLFHIICCCIHAKQQPVIEEMSTTGTGSCRLNNEKPMATPADSPPLSSGTGGPTRTTNAIGSAATVTAAATVGAPAGAVVDHKNVCNIVNDKCNQSTFV
ncbi:unnamed protein product [Medioppia subpectinata]|uniref:Uncharacterized protein n=1 Tax=Medioppia subpectinata TaxID=1979941 RepID=A0A7R9LJG5_9ACAR|nr:unnamed protein product [Medioppia subpectinata]CAG2119369.1 unnamed protein product [Medioppia subpectinata]